MTLWLYTSTYCLKNLLKVFLHFHTTDLLDLKDIITVKKQGIINAAIMVSLATLHKFVFNMMTIEFTTQQTRLF